MDVELRPAHAGAGMVFELKGVRFPVGLQHASAGPGHSCVGPVSTPEHLLAAAFGVGITDLEIHLSSPELPGLDGSAAPWLDLLGAPVTTGSTTGIELGPARIEAFTGTGTIQPAPTLQISVELDFGAAYQANIHWEGDIRAIASARTFLLHRDLVALQDAGRGQGLCPRDVLVLGARGPLVPMRSPLEWAEHKLLDLMGDLALVGRPLRGIVRVCSGSHALHLALLRASVPPPSRSD